MIVWLGFAFLSFSCFAVTLSNISALGLKSLEEWTGLYFGFSTGLLAMVLRNATNHSIQLEKWLIENRENIKNGTAEYDGLRVTPETKVAQFSYVFSALVLSIEFSGRRYFTDEHTVFAAIGASIYSLLFGILLIPLGPYYAVKAAYKNLVSGGVQTTVKELFAAMDKAAEEQAKKA